jgi:Flp pilus assembly protein TadD
LGGQGGSASARLTIWRATLDLVGERPLLGYGLDTLGLVFPKVYPPQLVYYQGRGVLVDRAHNLFLDWLATGGIVGLVAGLAMLGAFFIVGWRVVQRTNDPGSRALLAACLATVAGNAAGNLVSFDVTVTATATWMLMAVVAALDADRLMATENLDPVPASAPPRWVRVSLATGLLVGVGVGVVAANVRPQAADMAADVSDRRAANGDWLGAAKAGEQAVALWPGEPAHRLALSWSYLQQALAEGGNPLPWLQQAEAELLVARVLRPGDYHVPVALGELYGVWGTRWDPARLPLAAKAYSQAATLAPNQAMIYTSWGMLALESGQLDEAAVRFQQAVDLDATDGYAFAHLGDVELARGRPVEACAAYVQAAHWAPDLIYAHLGLARCRWQLGERADAKEALDAALALDPSHPAVEALRLEMGQGP